MKPWTHELQTIYDACGIMVCRCSTVEQAARIVEAVNSFERLEAIISGVSAEQIAAAKKLLFAIKSL